METTILETITSSVESLFGIVTALLDQITGNPWLAIFFVAGLVFTGVRILNSLKG